ncbi:MAG TPA: hypothetical protein VGE99_10190 [Candidatus Dormibacteraeota bacterium]
MRALLAAGIGVIALGSACSSGAPSTFAITRASVDTTYWCPGGANDAPYDVHATITVHNGTGKTVTIESVNAVMTLASVHGNWLERIGEQYDAGSVTFAPATIGPGSSATLKVTIPSTCTSGKYAGEGTSSGDYQVTMHLVTSAGPFSITAANEHEILTA